MVFKIALTGATGFVGGFVLPGLLAKGYEVSVLVRRSPPEKISVGARVVVGALDNVSALNELVHGADCVVHVAGAISALSEAQYFKVNVDGVRAVYEAAAYAGVKRFVHVSSLAARQPDISPYAASKRAGEDYLQSLNSDMSIVVLRPSAIYGPGDRATLPLLASLQKSVAFIPSTVSARFSLIHVRDFAEVIVDAVTSQRTGVVEVDDLTGGYSWDQLAAANVAISNLPKRTVYLPRSVVFAVGAVSELVSFFTRKPSLVNRAKVRELYNEDWVVRGDNWDRSQAIGLGEGLKEALEWYRSEGWLPQLQVGK